MRDENGHPVDALLLFRRNVNLMRKLRANIFEHFLSSIYGLKKTISNTNNIGM
jgi:hypothetical protein